MDCLIPYERESAPKLPIYLADKFKFNEVKFFKWINLANDSTLFIGILL